jgi:hypothetical protein
MPSHCGKTACLISISIDHFSEGNVGRFISRSISELSAVAFAIFLYFFFYKDFWQVPSTDADQAITNTYLFCAICAAYWWFQSGMLAIGGVRSARAMAMDILFSIVPLFVVGYFLLDLMRGIDPRIQSIAAFKKEGAYFALGIIFLDITFNVMIMARLSRRYLGDDNS